MNVTSILIVEDSGIELHDIKRTLKSLGYNLAGTAATKEEAIQKARDTQPDLTLMGIRLGNEIGGIEVAEYIRQNFDIPTIFLVGQADEDTFQRAKIAAPFGYILKPFDPQSLQINIEVTLYKYNLEKQLSASELRYRQLVENLEGVVWEASIEPFEFTYIGPKLKDFLDYDPEDWLDSSEGWRQALHPEDREKVEAWYNQQIEAGESCTIEYRVKTALGQTKWLRDTFSLVRESDQSTRMHGILWDITQQKLAENVIRESEERYRTLVDLAPEAVYVHRDGKFLYANRAGLELFGASNPGDVVGTPIAERVHPDYREKVRERVQTALSRGEAAPALEEVFIRLDDSLVDVEVVAATISYQGNPAMLTVVRDISERKQAEEAIRASNRMMRESEARYRALFEQSHDAVFILDMQGNHLEVNQRAADMLGYTVEELKSKSYRDISGETEQCLKVLERLLNGEHIPLFEHKFRKKNGEFVNVEINVELVRDDQGKPIHIQSVARDITNRKMAEVELQKSQYLLQESQKIAGVGHYELDIQTGIWRSSETLNELFGIIDWKPETNVSDWLRIVHPDDRETMENYFIAEVVKKKKPFDKKYRIRRIDNGQTRWVHGLGKLEFDSNSNPVRMIGSIQDITEREQTESIMQARLRLAEYSHNHNLKELLQQTLDEAESLSESKIGFYHIVGEDQKTISLQAWSTRTLDTFSNANGESLHNPIDEAGVWTECIFKRKPVIHNDYASLSNQHGLPEGHVQVERELTVPILRGDKVMAVLGLGNKEVEYNKSDINVVSNLADHAWEIAERKRAQDALQQSEALYYDLVETAQDLIWQCDADGRYTYLNPAWETTFGYKLDEMLGHHFTEFQTREQAERDMAEFSKILTNNAVAGYETVHSSKNGDDLYLVFNAKPVREKNGGIIGARGTAYDITKRVLFEKALHESESRYRELFNGIKSGVAVYDAIDDGNDFIFKDFNRAGEQIDKLEKAQVIGKTISELFAPTKRVDLLDTFRRVWKTGEPEHFPVILYEDEMIVSWRENYVYKLPTGELVAVFDDVTERTEAIMALRESERRFRETFENLQLVALTLDTDGNVTFCNDFLLQLIGWKREDLLGKNWFDTCIPVAVRLQVRQVFENSIPGGTVPSHLEGDILTREGQRRWIIWNNTVLKNIQGTVIGTASIGEDITERKKFEEALRLKSDELEALFSISTHLRSAQTADEMLPVVLKQLHQALDIDTSAVILLDPDEEFFTYALADGVLAPNTGEKFSVSNSISGLVYHSRRPYVSKNLSVDPNNPNPLVGVDELGPGAVAPILSEADFLGVLACARKKDRTVIPFSVSEVQLLMAIGEMVGNAMRRARLYDQAISRLQHVQALHSVDMAISANLDINITLEILLNHITAQMNCDAADVLLLDNYSYSLDFAAGHGFRSKGVTATKQRLGDGLAGWVAINRKPLTIPDLKNSEKFNRRNLIEENFASYFGAPLISKGNLLGVLEIFSRSFIPADDEQLDYLEALAIQAAIAIDNAKIFSQLQNSNLELSLAYDATIEGWSRALELRDMETEGHTLRVTEMTLKLAKAMGLPEKEFTHLRHGALLHDIGKMGIPDRILLKPGKLNDEEWEIMKKHTVYAFEMLWPIDFLRPAIDIPHCHHEKWDGSGYPRGLKGEEIPLAARIFAVADVYDALTTDRPYRKAWSHQKTMEYICNETGKHFQPEIVDGFKRIIED